MNKLFKLIVLILIINFSLILFLSSFRFLVFNEAHYDSELKKLNVYGEVPEAGIISKNIIDFFKGENELSEIFDKREAKHLVDVKNLIDSALLIFYFLVLIEIFVLTVLFFALGKKGFLNVLPKIFVYGSAVVLSFSVMLFILSFSFSSLFASFHSLFFQAETWIFPAGSTLTSVFPFRFFYDFFYTIILYSCAEAFLVILVCFFFCFKEKIFKQCHLKQKK